jgi:hypothetical protein
MSWEDMGGNSSTGRLMMMTQLAMWCSACGETERMAEIHVETARSSTGAMTKDRPGG